jgi:hypothetical protein
MSRGAKEQRTGRYAAPENRYRRRSHFLPTAVPADQVSVILVSVSWCFFLKLKSAICQLKRINPLAEALDNGGNVSLEIMNHVKAQILRAHLQLDDLEELLDSLD